MMTRLILVLLVTATPALAQAPCAPHATVVANLAARFGETLEGLGVAGDTRIAEVYANARTGTWSLVITDPDGNACLVLVGTGWQTIPWGDPA